MPPSPGHIHQLPVKVLYSLDGASQSYLTVLGDLQDVYIHPGSPGYGSDDEPGPVGSTLLKALAQGVCHASPECTPNQNLDFSVYALDPSPPSRPRPSIQPFASNTEEISWAGKGFLSWAISEPNSGSTLIKGRLVKEYDFDLSRFSEGGGLEGLMRAGGGDGRGWGLEVVVTLKMVRGEFGGRSEFERMLYNPIGSGSAVNPNTNVNAATNTNTNTTRPPASSPRTRPILPPPPPRPTTSPQRPSSSGPLPTTTTNGGPAQRAIRPPPSTASRSSLPPSSVPMAPSSSGPSRPSSSSAKPSDTGRTPTNNQNSGVGVGVGVGVNRPPAPPPPSGPSRQPTPQPQHQTQPSNTITPPKSTSKQLTRNREITPPPLPRPRSPPPTTPHRRALRDLLQADGKMSPSLAKDLVNNPSLLALLKSIPTTSGGGKGKEKEIKSEGGSGREGTPTPTAPKKGESIPGGCFNCGTMETTMWRVKTYADGTKKKVCDACGLYFNKTKKMRPKELWDHTQAANEPSSSKRPASAPIRQSPRLSRTHGNETPSLPPPPESPSKRRRISKPIPQPSPRMATRSSGIGVGVGAGNGRMDPSPFPFSSPVNSSQFGGNGNGNGFGTSPAVPLESAHMSNNGPANTNGIEDMDLDALLAQLTNATTNSNSDTGGNRNENGNGDGMDLGFNLPPGLNLEELFATVDNAARNDDALAEDMMKFLAGLEDQGQGQGQGGAEEGHVQNANTSGTGDGNGNGNGMS